VDLVTQHARLDRLCEVRVEAAGEAEPAVLIGGEASQGEQWNVNPSLA